MKMAPDSYRYLALGAGKPTHPPFNRRVLFPFICRGDKANWDRLNKISLLLLPVLVATFVYSHLNNWMAAVFAGFLMAGMPSMKFWYDVPILVDAPSLCLALLAAILPYPLNIYVVLIGGMARETVPVFAALYAWDPVLLVGLVTTGLTALVAKKGPDQLAREEWLNHPFKNAQKFKRGLWLSPDKMLYPWGAGLVAMLYPSWQLFATVVVAYAQLLMATDFVRLYVWAAPIVLLSAAQVDVVWMVPLAVIHLFNPKKGDGT